MAPGPHFGQLDHKFRLKKLKSKKKPVNVKLLAKLAMDKQNGGQMEREMEGVVCWGSDGGQGLAGRVKAGLITASDCSYQPPARK